MILRFCSHVKLYPILLPIYSLHSSVLENYRTNVRFQNPEVIKKRPMRTTPGNLKIAQVNEMLDRLSQASKE